MSRHTDVSLMQTNDNSSTHYCYVLEHIDVPLMHTNDNSSTQ